MIVRVTKSFSFEMAHSIPEHPGKCKNIHGHSYKLWVTLKGPVNPYEGGMVVDFKDLKTLVNKHLIDKIDHALIMNGRLEPLYKDLLSQISKNIIYLAFSPTAENLLIYFRNLLIPHLPSGVSLEKLKLRETENSYAELLEDDNINVEEYLISDRVGNF